MKKISPVVIIILSFFVTILAGTLILKLPISIQQGKDITWMDSFFLSTSATCVTGLTTIADIGATLSVFGKIVLTLLIQIGGLGTITISTLIFLFIGAKLGINDRFLLKEALNQNSIVNIQLLVKSIIKITLCIEIMGAIINFFVFINYYDFFSAIGISIFHSISAFCNAGFDILGNSSLINYSNNIVLNINTMLLVVLGGLGFIVIMDLLKNKFNYKKLTNHSKIVITMTVLLILFGTLFIKLSMADNVNWLQAIFQSVTSRTAGFATINCASLTSSAVLIMSLLMIIGASPSSTGGGIKTTTLYTMIKSMVSFSKGKQTIVSNRKISETSKLKAFTLFFFAITIISIATIAILIIEEKNANFNLINILFETCSAFGTVGLSMGITPIFSNASKIIICILMFFGRIGPITIMGMWNTHWNRPNVNNVDYLEEKILIG